MEHEVRAVGFAVTGEENGWIFGELTVENCRVTMANSSLGGSGLPEAMMNALAELLAGNTEGKWLCWHGESCCHIWSMVPEGDLLRLRVYLGGCSFGLPAAGAVLADTARRGKLLLDVWTVPELLAQSVLDGSDSPSFRGYRPVLQRAMKRGKR